MERRTPEGETFCALFSGVLPRGCEGVSVDSAVVTQLKNDSYIKPRLEGYVLSALAGASVGHKMYGEDIVPIRLMARASWFSFTTSVDAFGLIVTADFGYPQHQLKCTTEIVLIAIHEIQKCLTEYSLPMLKQGGQKARVAGLLMATRFHL